MKYNVEVTFEGMTLSEIVGLTKKEAINTAKSEASKNEDNKVFISWSRSSDGQNGYLNSDGDHAITGKAW